MRQSRFAMPGSREIAEPERSCAANDVVARRLEEAARLLEIQRAEVHRVRVRGGAMAGKRVVRGRERECTRLDLEEKPLAPPGESVLAGAVDPEWWKRATLRW